MKTKARTLDTGHDFRVRSSGVLMHVTSLPGPHGSGDLGPEALRFVEFLAAARQTWWQMLPIGPAGRAPSWSPYDSASAFAGNPWLVSLAMLAGDGLLTKEDLEPARGFLPGKVNFPSVHRFREERLRRAFARFQRRGGESQREFREYCDSSAHWLDDFSLFMALRRESGGQPWTEWEPGLRKREPSALRAARDRLAPEIAGHRFVQFEFDRQWRALHAHACRHHVGLIGDLPLFVAHDSADVWSHPDLFQLDRRGRARRISGYPPDRFNANGQHWGHPQYHWANHERTGFKWWTQRFGRMFELFDAVRIDHFLGLTRTWSIPAKSSSPKGGRWVPSPGQELLSAVVRQFGSLPMIAEDLGLVTAADIRLRDAFGLAPMRIFQFGFGDEPDAALHLPQQYLPLSVAYSGNHDNNTLTGWLRDLRPAERKRVAACAGGGRDLSSGIFRSLMASPAGTVIIPMQDLLGLGRTARMNVPGTAEGNWGWRWNPDDPDSHALRLRSLTETSGRQRSPHDRPSGGSRPRMKIQKILKS